MNIVESETLYLVEAKTCEGKDRGRSVSYYFIESSHSLGFEKGELIFAQIQACERLLKYTKDNEEIHILKDELAKLKLVLNLIRY